MKSIAACLTAISLYNSFAAAQECSSTITASSYPAPSLASGWSAHIIANGFSKPRSMKIDTAGAMLVVDQDPVGGGIWRLTFDGEGPCLSENGRTHILQNGTLNHGIELSPDGETLYASSHEAVYAWPYDAESGEVGEARRVIDLGVNGTHATRTLLLPPNDPDFLLVSWGSDGNVDPLARDPASGHSTVKAFNISETDRVWDFASEGLLVGWGLRNSVGLSQNPVTGGLWSNENGVDDLTRDGEDIVEDNPAEELNYHGYLNGTESANFGAYYGYPDCYAAWDADDVPNNDGLETGEQFAANFNESITDDWCQENAVDPVLSFTAHMAPMDQEFNTEASVMYITFRGSWNRENPAGYKLAAVQFDPATGMPTENSTSREPYMEIMSNEDLSGCPDECFRPVGLEWSSDGEQLFMAADASGEIYVVYREDGSSVNDFSMSGSSTNDTTEDDGDEDTTEDNEESTAVSLAGTQWWMMAAALASVGAYVL